MKKALIVVILAIAAQAQAAWNGYPWSQDADSNNVRLVYGKYDVPEQMRQGIIERWTNMPNFLSHPDLVWVVSSQVRTGWTFTVVTNGGWVYTNKTPLYGTYVFTNSYTSFVAVVDGVAVTSYYRISKFEYLNNFEDAWMDVYIGGMLGPNDNGIEYRYFIDSDAGAPDNMDDLWWGRTNGTGKYPSGTELPCVCMGNARSNAGDVTVGGWTNDGYGRMISLEALPETQPWIDLTDYDFRVELLNQLTYTAPLLSIDGSNATWSGSASNWADAVYNASTSAPVFTDGGPGSRMYMSGVFFPAGDTNGMYYVTARSFWCYLSNTPPSVAKVTARAWYVQAKNANGTITNDANSVFDANGDPWGAAGRLAKMTFWKSANTEIEYIGDQTLAFPAWAEPAEPATNGVTLYKGYTFTNAVRICTYDFDYSD